MAIKKTPRAPKARAVSMIQTKTFSNYNEPLRGEIIECSLNKRIINSTGNI